MSNDQPSIDKLLLESVNYELEYARKAKKENSIDLGKFLIECHVRQAQSLVDFADRLNSYDYLAKGTYEQLVNLLEELQTI